jgi:hypothetical protein
VTVVDATGTQQKPGRYMPAARKRQLLVELAVGETPMRTLANKYGITYQHARRIASQERAPIEELKAEVVAGAWSVMAVRSVQSIGLIEAFQAGDMDKVVAYVR